MIRVHRQKMETHCFDQTLHHKKWVLEAWIMNYLIFLEEHSHPEDFQMMLSRSLELSMSKVFYFMVRLALAKL